jgi:hypothetical protein
MTTKKRMGSDPLPWIGEKKAAKKKATTDKATPAKKVTPSNEALKAFVLHMPASMHLSLKIEAAKANVTINELILARLTKKS